MDTKYQSEEIALGDFDEILGSASAYQERRIGRINISGESFAETSLNERIFAALRFCVLDKDYNFVSDYHELTGSSPYFSPVNEGKLIPLYRVIMRIDDNGVAFVCAEKSEAVVPVSPDNWIEKVAEVNRSLREST
ncbi:MAG: hypothetical protein AAF702_44520 [Chloroflexota bacterium]